MTLLAVIQFDMSFADPRDNFARAMKLAEQAVAKKAQMILWPENFTVSEGFDRPDQLKSLHQEFLSILQNFALRNKAVLLAPMPEFIDSKMYNSLFVINGQGAVQTVYQKINLFSPMGEDQIFVSGSQTQVSKVDDLAIGLNVCYDLRFPEPIREQIKNGAKLLVFPAKWPQSRIHHYKSLLVARAIEGQCYVAGSNRIGKNRLGEYSGESMIVDPWGEIVAQAGSGEEIIYAEINLAKVDAVRKKIPCLDYLFEAK
jgi:predicted amidohydrolase